MFPYALIDLHCDTLTTRARSLSDAPDSLDNPESVLSLSAIPPEVHWAQFYAIFIPDRFRGPEAIAYYEKNRLDFSRQMSKFKDRVAPCVTPADMERAWSDGKTVRFTVSDNGVRFDPTAVPPADTTLAAEDRPVGGLGIHLARTLMDTVRYERADEKNILTLEKKL